MVNSSGLTDFNPDLRDALLTNVDAAVSVVDFVRQSDHAGLLHLSTCYVAGARDGRVGETLRPNYTPAGVANFDADLEWRSLHQFVKQAEEKAESAEITEELRRQAMQKEHASKDLKGAALENQIRKNRVRWLRTYLTEAGKKRAQRAGLAEHLHADQESGGVVDSQVWRRTADCDGAAVHRGNLVGKAVPGLE